MRCVTWRPGRAVLGGVPLAVSLPSGGVHRVCWILLQDYVTYRAALTAILRASPPRYVADDTEDGIRWTAPAAGEVHKVTTKFSPGSTTRPRARLAFSHFSYENGLTCNKNSRCWEIYVLDDGSAIFGPRDRFPKLNHMKYYGSNGRAEAYVLSTSWHLFASQWVSCNSECECSSFRR